MIYSESQNLPVPILVAAVVFLAGIFIGPVVFAWAGGRFHPQLILAMVAPLVCALMLTSLRLTTSLDDSMITARIWPFPAARLEYSDIRKVEEVSFAPIADFGGWGIRYGLGGKIYSMRGAKGVKLTLVSGEIFYLGTQDPQKLAATIATQINAR